MNDHSDKRPSSNLDLTSLVTPDSATAKAMESVRRDMEEIQRLAALSTIQLPRFEMGAAAHLAKTLEEHQRQWREIARPLETISAGLRIENEFARILEAQKTRLADIANPFQTLSESLRRSMESAQLNLNAATSSYKMLLQDFDDVRRLRLEELAKPFQIAKSLTESAFSETLKLSLSQFEIAQHFRLPALDPLATSAIAKLWEAGDLQERIRLISEDLERALQEAEAAELAGPAIEGAPVPIAKPHFIHLDFWTIFGILLTLATFAYQEISSSQMEARLTEKIDNGNAAAQKQMAKLQALLVQAMSLRQPWEMGQTQFVVRSRVATIRRNPKSGSAVVAEVFPNQVVALLDESGKWIHVEYFDWVAGEKRDGWALKKYFVRVRPVTQETSSEDKQD